MLSNEELQSLQADKVVDARGTACPGPLLEAKKSIAQVNEGQIMEVLSSDEGTKRDIPKWCQKKGHTYLGVIDEPGYFRLFLKK
jgi:tRNA 2-thiouridine synthesizing protein A